MNHLYQTTLLLIALFLATPILAQKIIIEGAIKDKETKESLPFAHIFIENSSTVAVADVDGIFSIAVPKEEQGEILVISMVGYDNFEQKVANIQSEKQKEFLLNAASFDLQQAVVRAPETIVKDALEKIEANYWTDKFLLEGFYRKAAIEDNKYTFLSEVTLRVFNKGYHKIPEESMAFELMQMRNSLDFRRIETIQTKNPLIIGLYGQDKIKNRSLIEHLNKQKRRMEIETSVYNGEDIYILKKGRLTVYIGFENDEIYRIDVKQRNFESSHQYRKYKGKLYQFYHRRKNFIKRNGKIKNTLVNGYGNRSLQEEARKEAEVVFRERMEEKNKDLINPDRKARQIKNITRRLQRKKSQKVLEETDIDEIGWIHEFTATSFVPKLPRKYRKKANLDAKKDLFETEIFYDKDFWANYNTPSESKFLQQIKTDLEAAANGKSLEQQFIDTGKINNIKSKKSKKS